jgi:hypothetical protein
VTASCDNTNDFCGVHHNSGVGNHAAALITDGGSYHAYTITGLGIARTAELYYGAQGLLTSTSQYRDLYNALLQSCAILTGAGRLSHDNCVEVKQALDSVGMNARHGDPSAGGNAIQDLYGCRQNELTRNDDGSSGRVDLPFEVNFFGNVHHSLYVNNNGNVTFDAPLGTFTPFGLTSSLGTPIIAPFFADIDTRNPGSDVVTWGTQTDGRGGQIFCVDWGGTGVGYFAGHVDKLVRAQLLIIDRSHDTGGVPGDVDLQFNYDGVAWETGDASGGRAGVGGSSVRVGYSGAPGCRARRSSSTVPGATAHCWTPPPTA